MRPHPQLRVFGSPGTTLVEILVALVLAGVVGLAVGGAYVFVTRTWFGNQYRLEAQQNLRIAVERLSRQLRLAGACVPNPGNPDIRPLSGADGGDRDELRIRINVRCAATTTRAAAPQGTSVLQVDRVDGFVSGMHAYLLHPGGQGQYVQVVNVVSGGSPQIQVDPSTSRDYPVGSAVYGAEEQLYSVQDRNGVPTLMLAVGPALGRPAEPLALGVERFDVQYVLNRRWAADSCVAGYPVDGVELCVVDQPATDAEWALVRVVRVTLRVRSTRPVPALGPWQFYRLEHTFDAKPRNLLKPIPNP